MAKNEKPGVMAGPFQNKKDSSGDTKPRVFSSQPEIRFELEVSNWKPFEKNTLLGFFDVMVCGAWLEIKGCTLHSKNGKRWVSFPGRSYTDKDGSQHWQKIVEIAERGDRQAFQNAALKAIDELRGEGAK